MEALIRDVSPASTNKRAFIFCVSDGGVASSGVAISEIPSPIPDPTRAQWMKLAAENPGLDFWNDPEEDIYTAEDGQPI